MSWLDVHGQPTSRCVLIAATGLAALGGLTVDVRRAGPIGRIDAQLLGKP
jgi:hypothetical protein